MPFNCIFYCCYFDIYPSGLARSVLFFVPVYLVKISTVLRVLETVKKNTVTKTSRQPVSRFWNIGQNYTKLIINESEPGAPRFLKNLNASVENEREIGWGLLFLTCEHHIQIGRPQILFSHCTEYWKFVLSQNLYLSYSKG